MLTLALVSYQGFQNVGTGWLSDRSMRVAVEDVLAELTPLGGAWELAWGPVTYRMPFTLFADSAMFVARRKGTSRYAIAIRGTNPVSLPDWVFGDVWSGRTTPWRFGDPGQAPDAAISYSSALGLSILRAMRARPAAEGFLGRVRRFWDSRVGDPVRRFGRDLARSLGGELGATLRRSRGELRALLEEMEGLFPDPDAGPRDEGLGPHEVALLARRRVELRDEIFSKIDAVFDALPEGVEPDLLRLLEGGTTLRNLAKRGVDLRTFLARAVEESKRRDEPMEVVVTGHSKGGALAPTLTLWLADTQGTAHVHTEDQWDPERRATLRAFAFAGPTAGNRAFAEHSDATIGPAVHRIANVRDVVPHAWVVHAEPGTDPPPLHLEQIPNLVSGVLDEKGVAVIRELTATIAEEVADLDYAQIGGRIDEFDDGASSARTLLGYLLGEHLLAYIEHEGLQEQLTPLDLMSLL